MLEILRVHDSLYSRESMPRKGKGRLRKLGYSLINQIYSTTYGCLLIFFSFNPFSSNTVRPKAVKGPHPLIPAVGVQHMATGMAGVTTTGRGQRRARRSPTTRNSLRGDLRVREAGHRLTRAIAEVE